MFFRLKLALRLRDCLSHPHGEGKRDNSKARSFSDPNGSQCGTPWKGDDASFIDESVRKGRSASSLEEAEKQLLLLIDDLKSQDSASLRDAAARSCYELCLDRSEIRPLFLKFDAVDCLFDLARNSIRPTSRIFASLTLTSLTSHELCREVLMKNGILVLCLEQLKETELPDELKRGCLRAIGRLAKFNNASEQIVKLDGLRTITMILETENESLQRRALIALYFVAADKPIVQEACLEIHAIQPLLKLCQSSNPSVQIEALDVCKVLARSRTCAARFVQESGVRIFVAAASEGSSKEIKSSAYRVLQRLCNHGSDISNLIVQEGTDVAGCDLSVDGVDKLIDVFSTGVISLQEEAAKIVEELCQTDPIASS